MEARQIEGLGRLCAGDAGDSIVTAPAFPGIERIEARFFGDAFEPHRHDTYGLGVTLEGVQRFRYRGTQRHSLPGNIIVLHPDEEHDGGAGTERRLRYRMLYLEPVLLSRPLAGRHGALPFVTQPVVTDPALLGALAEALGSLDEPLEELLVDSLVEELAQGLLRHAGRPARNIGPTAVLQARRARDFLAANADRVVRSGELERLTGLDRYELSRHFRVLFGTSPHRFLLMRRLQRARQMIGNGAPLAEAAVATGFTDQSHMNRHFKKAFGMTPGRWAGLLAGAGSLPAADLRQTVFVA
ncbi:MAG TPA: AraC family transcriptional regulator [Dongiaceae bacterium]|nr:AraC family transcriptional regulator [Dongiaceae bacterium]